MACRDSHPKAGKWGGPPQYNRWTPKSKVALVERATPQPDRRQALRSRWDMLNDAAKARFAELAPPADDLDAVEAALNEVDAFAIETPPAPARVDEIQPDTVSDRATSGVVAHIATAIGESPWRDLINTWVGEAHAARVGWNPKAFPTFDNVARAATALEMARAAKGDGETIRALLLSQHTDAFELPIGAVLGALTAAQCAAVRELATMI